MLWVIRGQSSQPAAARIFFLKPVILSLSKDLLRLVVIRQSAVVGDSRSTQSPRPRDPDPRHGPDSGGRSISITGNRLSHLTSLGYIFFLKVQYVGDVRNCHGRMIATGKRMRKEAQSKVAAAIAALDRLSFLTARIGQWLAIPTGNITPIWIPSGLILAAGLGRGDQVRPGIFCGAAAGNIGADLSPASTGTLLRCLRAGDRIQRLADNQPIGEETA